ncbi:MAG: hypothetical protein M3371_04740 [Acidobacteriota bacterium]|nr:hypothetical protein [Acidobacteriota bacterium]
MRFEVKAPGVLTTRAGALETKPFRIGSGDGLFLFPTESDAPNQLFAPCPSCAHKLRLTAATIKLRGITGSLAVCERCRDSVEKRGLVG